MFGLSKRVASSAKTLFQSCFRYSNCFFFSSSFISFCFWAFSYTLALVAFLAFWAAYLMQWTFTTSSKHAWSLCSSSYFLCISYHCYSSISPLFCKILEGVEEDMIIQKKDKFLFFLFMYYWPRYHHRFFG